MAAAVRLLTDYLSRVGPEWKEKVGPKTTDRRPVGIAAKGNEGRGQVGAWGGGGGGGGGGEKKTAPRRHRIHQEQIYTQQNKMRAAALKNKAGEFVSPTIESITQALASADVPDDFRFSIVNPEGKGAYPIAGVTWLLVYELQNNPEKGRKLVEFLKWMLVDGEKMAPSLSYAPLPVSLVKRVQARVETIKY